MANLMSVFGSGAKTTPAAEATGNADDALPEGAAAPGAGPSTERSVMILGKTIAFKGELWAEEDVILLGRVEGKITHSASITVGMGGTVIGDICARFVTIKGTVEGDIEATESVMVTPTGCVFGDIAAPRVGVVEGARFTGSVRMTVAATTAAAAAPAAATKTGTAGSASPAASDALPAKAVDNIPEKG